MRSRVTTLVMGVGILMLPQLISETSFAQVAGLLAGTITNQSGAVVPNAKISVKNLTTGQLVETQADSAGLYSVANLVPGDYQVSVSAEGFPTKVARVTIAEAGRKTMNVTLGRRTLVGGSRFLARADPGKRARSGKARQSGHTCSKCISGSV